jgi:hypothetical protein
MLPVISVNVGTLSSMRRPRVEIIFLICNPLLVVWVNNNATLKKNLRSTIIADIVISTELEVSQVLCELKYLEAVLNGVPELNLR